MDAQNGIGVFGPAYKAMYECDPHANGSVDRVLLARMVRLTDASATGFYAPEQTRVSEYESGTRPLLEGLLSRFSESTPIGNPHGVIGAILNIGEDIVSRAAESIDNLVFGGTEEQIFERGSDWCTDLARLACCLSQVGGYNARLAFLADISKPYSGHAICEMSIDGRWLAVDATYGIEYRSPNGDPLNVWQLVSNPLQAESVGAVTDEVVGYFRAAALVEYCVVDVSMHDYSISRIDEYNRSILEEASLGWSGGLRWLHGEDSDE